MADHVLNGVIAPRRGAASRRAGYDVWRELDPEDSLRFYALWLHEFGQLESTPNGLIADEWYLDQTRNFRSSMWTKSGVLPETGGTRRIWKPPGSCLGSHLRVSWSRSPEGFGGYGMPLAELVAEGNVGLMRALARFEPEGGLRFATYARWWIRAYDRSALRPEADTLNQGFDPGSLRPRGILLNPIPFGRSPNH